MKNFFVILALIGMCGAVQAQQLMGKVAPPADGSSTAQIPSVEFRTINGMLPPAPVGQPQARRVAAYQPSGVIYGTRVYSNVWSDYYHSGVYVLDTNTPEFYPIYLGDMFTTTRGVCYIDGRLWLSHVERGFSFGDDYGIVSSPRVQHYLFNLYTGEVEMYINPGYPSSSGWSMVYDRYTGIIYGNFSNNSLNKDIFGTLDLSTGLTTGIAELPVSITGMVIDKQHRMWGIDRKTGILYEVDMTNGTLRKVGNTGVTSAYANCGCIDPITGVYYYNTCNLYESSLYAIDTETATATHVYTFPNNDEWGVMWMQPRLSDGVPQAPANVQATFNGLEVTVSFIVPRPLANGTMGQGEASYTVYVDGVAAATGEAAYGSTVSAPIDMEHGGQAVVAVALNNDQGESDIVRQTVTVGDAAVPAPASVTLAKSGNNFKVTWEAVAIDGATYDLVRYPDEAQVATGLTTTTFTEAAPGGGRSNYFYTVTARVGNAQSKPTRSNYLASGQFTLPYSNHFETEDRANELTYINANNDTYVWTYAVNCNLRGEHGIYVPKNNRELSFWEQMQDVVPETDDWAITPGLYLEGGKSYTVTYRVFSMYEYSNYTERYEVKMGTSPTVAAMTTTIKGATVVLTGNTAPREDCTVFTAPADGTYYIGLHGISQGGFWFGCLGIDVSEGYEPSAPYYPMELTVTPDANGDLKADVLLRTSGWNTQRKALDGYDRIDLLANDQLVYTWQAPALRETYTTTIDLPRDGNYDFVAVPYGLTGGRGISLKTSTYIGVRPPADVTGVTIAATDNPGEVSMTWPPVTTNIDGAAIDGSKITYNVYNADEQLMGEELTDTQLTFRAMDYESDPQQFLRYYVTSHFNTYYSAWAGYTPYLLMGKPYELPFYESTTTGETRYAWLPTGDVTWDVVASSSDLMASDGDGSFLAMIGTDVDQTGTYTSGKIHISGKQPKLTFDYATLQNCTNTLAVKVICDGVTTTLGTITLGGSTSEFVWSGAEYALDDFMGKDIQLEFTGAVVSHAAVIIDAIRVSSTPDTEPGDVNGDGAVDVEDVNALINVILDLTTADALAGIADVNGDGVTDIEDVNALINLILAQ
ncbi:MAG: dockerin type I repeat-containing protein [Muribaculaceae bacterium]|nr:dockerin type I repeat-containing protein [Muribaculaceae bacterium]